MASIQHVLTHVQRTYNVHMGRAKCFLTNSCLALAMRGVFVNVVALLARNANTTIKIHRKMSYFNMQLISFKKMNVITNVFDCIEPMDTLPYRKIQHMSNE